MNIKVIITGGTFDKEYNELNGQLFFKESHLPEMLKLGRSTLSINLKVLMMIDSLEMETKDRKIIVDECMASSETNIVITHGTDTLVETAEYLAQHVSGKTIILTGAMIPYKFGSTDGLFNLGSSLAFAQSLPNGVFISMNGRYFTWDNVRKNKDIGLFESLK